MSSRAAETHNDRSPLLGAVNGHARDPNTPKWKHVLEHKITWAWYNVVIASGGVALLLNDLPYKFHKLWILGAIVYLFSLILFLLTFVAHVVRFVVRPSTIRDSMTHQNESLFVSTFPAALGILIMNGAMYSRKMPMYNINAMVAFYWIFVVLAIVFGMGSPLVQFAKTSAEHTPVRYITSSSLTSLLPLVLAGPVAAAVIDRLPETHHYHNSAISIVAWAIILQGMGIILTMFYQSAIVGRLSTEGYRKPRVALFLAVVGPALTSLAITSVARQALLMHNPKTIPPAEYAATVAIHHLGVALGLVFWGLAVWWFVVATVSTLAKLNDARGSSNHFMHLFNVIIAHVVLFLASNELLRAFNWPKLLTIFNMMFGVATVFVWVIFTLGLGYGVVSGRLMRD